MKKLLFISMLSGLVVLQGCSQGTGEPNKKVGGGCEGCEAIFESPISFEKLSWVDTLPDFNEPGPKMVISGVIYKADGVTPAKDVVLYVYHTDQKGIYSKKGNETGWGLRHGYIRGWMKTNEKGEYKFYTLKPAPYPGAKIPAHIHPVVKESDKNEYWIDEYVFDDDPLLTTAERKKQRGYGGNGIINLEERNGILYGERNIYLGRKIPDYPLPKVSGQISGLDLGDNCPAFDPLHVSGADKGKHVCPMCKYGYQQGVMVWINDANLDQMKQFAAVLESEMEKRGEKNLRVFLIYMNPEKKSLSKLEEELKKWAAGQQLKKVALLFVPSPSDPRSAGLFHINPSEKVKNTVFVYKKRRVDAKWININYDDESLKAILKRFDMSS